MPAVYAERATFLPETVWLFCAWLLDYFHGNCSEVTRKSRQNKGFGPSKPIGSTLAMVASRKKGKKMAVVQYFSADPLCGTWSPRIEVADAVVVANYCDATMEKTCLLVRKNVTCVALRYGRHIELLQGSPLRVWGKLDPSGDNEKWAGHPVVFCSADEADEGAKAQGKALADQLGIPFEGFRHAIIGLHYGRAVEYGEE